ncbi:hypothetical protein BDR26DRAFT_895171 [Obelidium mucronatum]|nr:hypothetical protein BDR26DRAFT_895171 [Obelidium mucronatum]
MISRMRDSLFGRRTQEADTEAVIVGSLSGTTDPEALKIQPDVKPASGSIQESFEKKNKKPWVLGVVAALVLIGVAIYFGVTSNARNSSNNSSNNNNSLGNLTDSISNSVNLTSANINITFSTANTAKPNPKIAKAFAASTQIPGNLPLAQTPQFITLTGDDAVQQRTFAAFTPIRPKLPKPEWVFSACNLLS